MKRNFIKEWVKLNTQPITWWAVIIWTIIFWSTLFKFTGII